MSTYRANTKGNTMNLFDTLDEMNQTLTDQINADMEMISPEQIGLDGRCAYRVWISEEAIAVRKSDDGRMQYYGGFEYVDKEYRREFGDWVFYFADDERISDHLSQFYDQENIDIDLDGGLSAINE